MRLNGMHCVAEVQHGILLLVPNSRVIPIKLFPFSLCQCPRLLYGYRHPYPAWLNYWKVIQMGRKET